MEEEMLATRVMGGSVQGKTLPEYGYVVPDVTTVKRNCFYTPTSVTTDGTNLFVCDSGNHVIRRVVLATGAMSILAGVEGSSGTSDGVGSSARFYNPGQITTDGNHVYVADWSNRTIRQIEISSGKVTTIAGVAGAGGFNDGIGSNARFMEPAGITTDGIRLYISDTFLHTIRCLTLSTSEVVTIAGGLGGDAQANAGFTDGAGLTSRFHSPINLSTDGRDVFVADELNFAIRKLSIADHSVSTLARFSKSVIGITCDGVNLYVTHGRNTLSGLYHSVTITDYAGVDGVYGGNDGQGPVATFSNPRGITTDGQCLYVVDYNGLRKIV